MSTIQPDLTQSHLTTFTMQVFRALQPANTSATADDTRLDGTTGAATLAEIKVVGTDHGGGNDEANNESLGSAANLARFGFGTVRTLGATGFGTSPSAPTDAAAQTAQETAAKQWNDNESDAGVAIRYSRNQVFQDFVVTDEEEDDDMPSNSGQRLGGLPVT